MTAPSTDTKIARPIFCGADTKGGTGRCGRPSGWGTDHAGWGACKLHGGSTQSGRTAAQISMAKATVQLFGTPRTVHPLDGLLEDYYRASGFVDAYEAMAMQLLPDEVIWGVQEVTEDQAQASDGGESMTPPERKTKSGAGVNIWVKLMNEERDRRNKLGEAILRLDIDSRMAQISATQVSILTAVLLSPEIALTEDQRRAAARLLRGFDRPAIEGEVAA
jgi:hypothetical protein